MSKHLLITEKPSVAMEFAKVIGENGKRYNGYIESQNWIITWCVGHLVTMSYPEKYNPSLKQWRIDTLPFIPKKWKYEIIPNVKAQFDIIKGLMQREDIDIIYNAGDSGREGEYIQRLVQMMANPNPKAEKKRVWIDSQTEEEIKRGIKEAKPSSEYDNLSDSAYLRAKEDYLIGINFSRAITILYGNELAKKTKEDRTVISIGRVMTCVLGMIVQREREIRNFKKTPFYKIEANFDDFTAEWKVSETSAVFNSPKLYNESGFKKENDAKEFINNLNGKKAVVTELKKSKQKENGPLLFNLAELQNECTKRFKIKPDETLEIIQNLYEKKLVTYPRTDARVLSTAVAKVITKNLNGIAVHYKNEQVQQILKQMKENNYSTNLIKTKYVDDSKITDHYAIIPTGQGYENLENLPELQKNVYNIIVKRFLAIFFPPAEYSKINVTVKIGDENFYASSKECISKGYLIAWNNEKKNTKSKQSVEKLAVNNLQNEIKIENNLSNKEISTNDEKNVESLTSNNQKEKNKADENNELKKNNTEKKNDEIIEENKNCLINLKKNQELEVKGFEIKESETSAPTRYNSGSIILAMENAGKLIEDEALREQIKGVGIGTSATRAEIIHKLEKIKYIAINTKTQIITPTQKGEYIYDIVYKSMPDMLNPKLTASWEKGLEMVARGEIKSDEFMEKLKLYINQKFNKLVCSGW